jgi:ABC-type transport system involved in cytochrome c biogenesis permease subunit
MRWWSIFIVLIYSTLIAAETVPLHTTALAEVPVAYKGRYRPAEVAAKLWLWELMGRAPQADKALSLAWKLQLEGINAIASEPLLAVSKPVIRLLALPSKTTHISWKQLDNLLNSEETARPFATPLAIYNYRQAYQAAHNRSKWHKIELNELAPGLWVKEQEGLLVVASTASTAPWHALLPGSVLGSWPLPELHSDEQSLVNDLTALLTHYHSLNSITATRQNTLTLDHQQITAQLAAAGKLLPQLPSKQNLSVWYAASALDSLDPTAPLNFTAYNDAAFQTIYNAYRPFSESFRQNQATQQQADALGNALIEGYGSIAGKSYTSTSHRNLTFPSLLQLRAELWYHRLPLLALCIMCYTIATVASLLGWTPISIASVTLGWILHTMLLCLRIYILERPPVATMYETLLFVPWVAITFVLSFFMIRKTYNNIPAAIANATATALLIFALWSPLQDGLENVQAVLDSNYWLTVHVLMVVGSYAFFLVAGIAAHILLFLKDRQHHLRIQLTTFILQTMAVGVALLIPGTVLGGIWAAQSWGRFWDWDPKEAWAFITSCVYLIVIHAYYFRLIGPIGLACGAILGAWSTSFTWYGVNYILGSGLHSYGFGSGGEYYYLGAIGLDALIVICLLLRHYTSTRISSHTDAKRS